MSDGLFGPGRRSLTLGLVLTITTVASESLAIGTVMPLVTSDLGGLELYGWAFSAFFLGSLIGIVVVGGWLDRGGLETAFLAGLGLFALGLLVGGLAPSMPVLVAARFLQGLGAGAVPPVAYVAIGRSLPERLRPRMFAVLSTAWVLPGVIGPSVAAIVGQTIGWRWVFLGLLPLVAVAAVLTTASLAHVPAATARGGADDEADEGPDDGDARAGGPVAGRLPLALAVAAGAAIALAGLTAGGPIGLVAGLAGVALILPAYRALSPVGTLRLAAGVPAAVILRGVLTFAFFSADAYVPYLLVQARGLDAWTGGLAYTAATLTWTAGAWLQARLATRIGTRTFVGSGFLVVLAGVAVTLTVVVTRVPWGVAVVGWGLAGVGMGIAYAPLSLAVLRDAPAAEQGRDTSALQLSDTLGTALGTGVAGAVVVAADRIVAAGMGPPGVTAAALGIGGAFGLAMLVSVVGWAGCRRLPIRPVAG